MKILTRHELRRLRACQPGRRPRYDWNTLLDGRDKLLEWGVDFQCKPVSMRRLIGHTARRRNKKLRTHAVPNGRRHDDVAVTFPKEEE